LPIFLIWYASPTISHFYLKFIFSIFYLSFPKQICFANIFSDLLQFTIITFLLVCRTLFFWICAKTMKGVFLLAFGTLVLVGFFVPASFSRQVVVVQAPIIIHIVRDGSNYGSFRCKVGIPAHLCTRPNNFPGCATEGWQQMCRYPENGNTKRIHLPICPDSQHSVTGFEGVCTKEIRFSEK